MFSEHDEELNENEDAFMSVEVDVEAAAAEAGDESVLHSSIIDDAVAVLPNKQLSKVPI